MSAPCAARSRPAVMAGLVVAVASCFVVVLHRSPTQTLWTAPQQVLSRTVIPVAATSTSTSDVVPVVNGPIEETLKPTIDQETFVETKVGQDPREMTSLDNLEEQLEEMGSVISSVSTAALPLLAALIAGFTGFLLRRVIPTTNTNVLRPMEMAASEATPLTRRGMLAALSAVPMAVASPALAAKSGGRIGGSGFGSFKAAQPIAPQAAPQYPPPPPPTTVYVTPSPPMMMGSPYGFGMAPAMPMFSTGELLALSALELGEAFVKEQRRQEAIRQQLEIQRKLGQDEAQIQALQQQLAAQEQRMRDLESTMMQRGVPAPAS